MFLWQETHLSTSMHALSYHAAAEAWAAAAGPPISSYAQNFLVCQVKEKRSSERNTNLDWMIKRQIPVQPLLVGVLS